MGAIESVHEGYVAGRRVRRLCEAIVGLMPESARVLDVGSGDGRLARLLMDRRPDLEIHGIEVLVRQDSAIPCLPFDGRTIPHSDGSFDAVLFVDVLHHTDDPTVLLREARRVARRAIVLKDHTADGLLAHPTLRFMDRVGNARHGVALPYNYWSEAQWRRAFDELGLTVERWAKDLGLYPWPASWAFGRSLHFVARLGIEAAGGPGKDDR